MRTLARLTIIQSDDGKYCAVVADNQDKILEVVETSTIANTIKFGKDLLLQQIEKTIDKHPHFCLECKEVYDCPLPKNCPEDYDTVCPSCADEISPSVKMWANRSN